MKYSRQLQVQSNQLDSMRATDGRVQGLRGVKFDLVRFSCQGSWNSEVAVA